MVNILISLMARSPKLQEELGSYGHSNQSHWPAWPRALTAAPSGLQCEEGTASFQVIKNGVTRTKGGHDMGRLGAGEGH